MYMDYALTHTLIAMDRPRLFAFFTLAALVVNLICNLLLIPALGITGAAAATVVTEGVLFALCATAVLRAVRAIAPAIAEPLAEPRAEGVA
jgi:O-antigen/teichoic acid export membrane protein